MGGMSGRNTQTEAPDNVCNFHQMIIYYAGKMVGRKPMEMALMYLKIWNTTHVCEEKSQ